MEKIVVGLSGGIDSFVTALLLQQQGFEVIGVNLHLWTSGHPDTRGEELTDLCQQLNIKLYQVDGSSLFSRLVVQPFINGYLSGITPNPCATCNSFVKWHLIQSLADDLGVHYLSTGHYIRILPHENHTHVYKGLDPRKDQSYFLWGVPEEIIARTITPLGDYTKPQVKEIAVNNGFSRIAEKRESMSICFLEGGDYRDFIARQPDTASCFHPGPIVNRKNLVIGEHTGIVNYTIGQKKGIPFREEQPQYVAHIDATRNRLVVGDKSSLYESEFLITRCHINNPRDIEADDIDIKVRGLGLNPECHARVTPLPNNTLSIQLSSPAWAMAPGQPVALYRGDRLIGGGIYSI